MSIRLTTFTYTIEPCGCKVIYEQATTVPTTTFTPMFQPALGCQEHGGEKSGEAATKLCEHLRLIAEKIKDEECKVTNTEKEKSENDQVRELLKELTKDQNSYRGERDVEGLGGQWCSQCGEEWHDHPTINGQRDYSTFIEKHTANCPIVLAKKILKT